MIPAHGRATSPNVQAVMWLTAERDLPTLAGHCQRLCARPADADHVMIDCDMLRQYPL